MKVLILGAFDAAALERKYTRAFDQLGVDYDVYDVVTPYYAAIQKSVFSKLLYRVVPEQVYQPINRNLLAFLKGKRYDVVIVFKGMALMPSTIGELKAYTQLLVCYNPDHPFHFYSPGSGNINVRDSIRNYDLYGTYSVRIAAALKTEYGVESAVIPFGFDDHITPDLSAQQRVKGKFIFAGAYDRHRASLMERLVPDNILIFGDAKWATRTSLASRSKQWFTGRALVNQDYADAIAAADGMFNFLREQNIQEQSHNMRSFEVPGYGGVLISHRTEEQLAFFEEDKEAIYFDSLEELNDKLHFLKQHPQEIQKIKSMARQRSVRSGYTYTDRAKTLLDIIRFRLK